MNPNEKEWIASRLQTAVGSIMRYGVLTAAVVVVAGGAIYLARHGGEPIVRLYEFHSEPENLRSVPGIIESSLDLRGRAIVQFGLLLLIATPVARVAFSVVGFALERDRLYVVVSLIVLGFLLLSLIGSWMI